MSDPIVEVAVRPARDTDMSLVHNSWLESYRFKLKEPREEDRCKTCAHLPRKDVFGGAAVQEMHAADYFTHQAARITRLLRHSAVDVVHPVEAPDVVYAWACLVKNADAFHYVWTAKFRRHRGYAKMLVGDRKLCTHMTDSRRPDSFALWARRAGIAYIPHLLDG